MRLVAVLGLVFFFPPTIVAYVILALVLRPKPPALYASREEEIFWRGVAATSTCRSRFSSSSLYLPVRL